MVARGRAARKSPITWAIASSSLQQGTNTAIRTREDATEAIDAASAAPAKSRSPGRPSVSGPVGIIMTSLSEGCRTVIDTAGSAVEAEERPDAPEQGARRHGG